MRGRDSSPEESFPDPESEKYGGLRAVQRGSTMLSRGSVELQSSKSNLGSQDPVPKA